jgi:hypothetical protein
MKHLTGPSSNISDKDYPWTQDKIYKPPFDKPMVEEDGSPSGFGVAMPPRVNWKEIEQARVDGKTTHHTFTDEFFHELLRETHNRWIEKRTPLTVEERQEVEADRPCPRCFHDDYNLKKRGEVTGIITQVRVRCPCEVIKSINVWFHNPDIVPRRYWGAKLDDLAPVDYPASLLPVKKQREIIAILRKNPTWNYLLCGDTRCGKTHFSTALFHYALEQWAIAEFNDFQLGEISVFRMNAEACLQEHVAWANKKAGQRIELPRITVEKIRDLAKQGNRPCLFLDEIDKFAPTHFKLITLFKLVEAVAQVHGQIVFVSNARFDELRELWGKYDDTAAAILSRVCFEGENGAIIEFNK